MIVLAQRDKMTAVEGLDIEVVGCGRDEDFRVPSPAHALISLRAVSRHFEIVAFMAPDDVAVELI